MARTPFTRASQIGFSLAIIMLCCLQLSLSGCLARRLRNRAGAADSQQMMRRVDALEQRVEQLEHQSR